MNVTGTGVAVAVAIVVAVGLLFFGPQIFTYINHTSTQAGTTSASATTTQPTSTMDDQTTSTSSTSASVAANEAALNAVTQLEGKDLVVGTGAEAMPGDQVTVNYVGMLTNGQVFDASANHGTTGFTFTLGAGQVIKGWDEGVAGMKVGGQRELVIPASLGYGAQAVGPIPANSVLVFDVQLLNVQSASSTSSAQ